MDQWFDEAQFEPPCLTDFCRSAGDLAALRGSVEDALARVSSTLLGVLDFI
jgi:hypothetical protein